MNNNVLEVKNLKISFRTAGGTVKAVRNISFHLQRGKTLAIVGESGSGKSVTSKAILGILAGNAMVEEGEILYEGRDLLQISEKEMCRIRGDEISMIFQDPLSSLNPIVKIGKQITEAMLLKNKTGRRQAKKACRRGIALVKEALLAAGDSPKGDWRSWDLEKAVEYANAELTQLLRRAKTRYGTAPGAQTLKAYLQDRAEKAKFLLTPAMAKKRALQLMEEVGIKNPEMRYNQYPFEFSGGMRQRIVIAIALAADPEILICDEPTTALDVTIQAQILELINNLKEQRRLSVIFITHDLGVVANMADEIAVMYAGKIVEYGTVDEVFYDPRHPYTWALLSSMPDLDTKEKLDAIPGTPPNMVHPPVGDAFAPRNKYAMEIDFEMQPPEFYVSNTHWAATWLLHPDAPKVALPKIITDRIARMKQKAGGQHG